MVLPANWAKRRVTGKWVRFDGQPDQGTVTLTPSVTHLYDADADIIATKWPIPITLNQNGKIVDSSNVEGYPVPTTDDPNLAPAGWDVGTQGSYFTYEMRIEFQSGYTLTQNIEVRANDVPLDLLTVTPVVVAEEISPTVQEQLDSKATKQVLGFRGFYGEPHRTIRSALASVDSQPVNFMWIGDSFTQGFSATSENLTYTSLVRAALADRLGQPEGHYISLNTDVAYTETWTTTGGVTNRSDLGGIGIGSADFPDGSTATITQRCDRFWILFPDVEFNSNFIVSIDGGAGVAVEPISDGSISVASRVWDSGPLELGSHTVDITCNDGLWFSSYIEGAFFFEGNGNTSGVQGRISDADAQTGSGLRVWEAGHFGFASGDFTAPNETYMDVATAGVPVHHLMVNLGINDLGSGVSATTYQANLETIASIAATKNSDQGVEPPSVTLLVPYGTATDPTTWQPYRDAVYAAAESIGAAVIDVYELIGDVVGADDVYELSGDGTHLNNVGHRMVANQLSDMFLADWGMLGAGRNQASGTLALNSRRQAPDTFLVPQAPGRIVFSWDDSYRSQLFIADEAEKRNQRHTFFITTDFVGGDFMTGDEIAGLYRRGHEIGSHSHTHPDMASLTASERQAEWDTSKSILEDYIGEGNVHAFAYPFGGTARNHTTDQEAYLRYDSINTGHGGVSHHWQYPYLPFLSHRVDPGVNSIQHELAKQLIRKASLQPIVVGISGHNLDASPGDLTTEEFLELVDLAYELGVPCVTHSQVFGAGHNLIRNGGFEEGADGLDGWLITENTGDGSTVSSVTDTPDVGLTGTNSLKIDNATDAAYQDIRQDYPVIPGMDYTVSFRYRTASGDGAHGLRIFLDWRDWNNVQISEDALTGFQSAAWERVTFSAVAPANAAYGRFYITALNAGTTWADHIYLGPTVFGSFG